MKFYVLFAVLIGLVTGAPADSESRITGTGATRAVLGEAPWVVVILENSKVLCGGFLYSDRTVVTTVTCLDRVVDKTKLRVKAGTVTASAFTKEEQERGLAAGSIKNYPSYNPTTKEGDIALFTLDSPFLIDGVNVKPIRYDPVDTKVTTSSVAGWGAIEDGGLESTILYKAPVADLNADCSTYGTGNFVKNYMICASDPESSPCTFDEGAPLVQTPSTGSPYVVGIMSKNMGCAPATTGALYKPTVYTRLSSYYDWLINNAGQQPANL